MSTKGRIKENRDERDRNLLDAYYKTLSETPFPIDMKKVYAETVRQSSPQFWISSEQALKIISDIKRGVKKISSMRSEYAKMITTIMERMDKLKESNPELSNKIRAEKVIYSKAPSYYITPKSAKTIIHRIRRDMKKGKL
ncbi:MAG: hypothetical protein R3Y22_09010 [Bacteroidales bacterium]